MSNATSFWRHDRIGSKGGEASRDAIPSVNVPDFLWLLCISALA